MENVEKGDKLFPIFVLYYKRVILCVNLTGQREIVSHEPYDFIKGWSTEGRGHLNFDAFESSYRHFKTPHFGVFMFTL